MVIIGQHRYLPGILFHPRPDRFCAGFGNVKYFYKANPIVFAGHCGNLSGLGCAVASAVHFTSGRAFRKPLMNAFYAICTNIGNLCHIKNAYYLLNHEVDCNGLNLFQQVSCIRSEFIRWFWDYLINL
jgi:hypothetical protein